MLHVRVLTPASTTDQVVAVAEECVGAVNITCQRGIAVNPAGDVVEFDLAREAANAALARLRDLGLHGTGSITMEQLDLSISAGAEEAERLAPGDPDDAVVWDELAARVSADTKATWAFLTFLTLATMIAAIGALLDQPVLIVGAMVLGPEFGPVAALCFAALRRDLRLAGTALRSLVVGFTVAIAVTTAWAALGRAVGWIHPAMLDDRTLTDFIVSPDRWSFVVAVLAGIAGILSLTAGKSTVLVGVFISVTTVPAAGNLAVAIPLAHWGEVRSSLIQLGVNLAGMFLAGTLTLVFQRFVWARYGLRVLPPPPGAAPLGSRRDAVRGRDPRR